MSIINPTLPTIPPLPTEPRPTFDQEIAWVSLKMREAEFLQRVAHNADAERRNIALVEAHTKLAQVQEAVRVAMLEQIEQAKRLADLLAQPPAAPAPPTPAPPPVESPVVPYVLRFNAMTALVSSMTRAERSNPLAAAQAASDLLAAINAKA